MTPLQFAERFYMLRSRAAWFWHIYKTIKIGVELAILVVFVFIVASAVLLAPYGEWKIGVAIPFSSPWRERLFGTDVLSRDLFSLFLYDSRISLIVGVTAAVLSTSIRGIVGLTAGYWWYVASRHRHTTPGSGIRVHRQCT